jgi:hypothetical protein
MKYVFCLLISVLAGLVAASSSHAQKPHIQVLKHAEGEYTIVVEGVTSDSIATARQELMPEAKRVCGARVVHFGNYQFDGPPKGKAGTILLMQNIFCVDATRAPTTVVKDPTWRPTELQQAIILELTRRYFRMKDSRDYEQIRQMLANELPYADWLGAAEKFNQQSGQVRYRAFARVTWYVNPVNAFAPGLYTAVDFYGQFANIDIYCGFVVWHRGQEGVTRLLREEQNYISREGQQNMTADELKAFRKKLGC